MKKPSSQLNKSGNYQKEVNRLVREYQLCKDNPEYFIENYCYVINPDKPSGERVFKFKLWPQQKRLLPELLKFQDIFSEKSRDMGISWLVMAFELHQALFTEYFTALNLSRAEREVQDPGNTFHALMGRLAFMYDRLPHFLKLKVHNPFLTFHVLVTGSVIKGESANKNAGRDTQYKFVFVDEAAHIPVFSEMWKSLRNCCDAVMVNSTPPDDITDNKYVQLKDLTGSGFKHMNFHWKEHPEKDSDWYKKKTASMTQDEVDQELEIKYHRIKTEKSYPEYSDDIHRSRHKFYYNPNFPLYIFFDFGLAGEVMEFLQQDKDKRLFLLDVYEEKNLLTEEHYKNLIKILGKLRYQGKISEIIAYGDPFSGNRRSRNKITPIDEYRSASNGQLNIKLKYASFDEKRKCVKNLLKSTVEGRPQFQASVTCESFAKAMKMVRLNKQKTDHIDDWATHKVNAFEYGVSNLYPILKPEFIDVSVDSEETGVGILDKSESSIQSIVNRNRSRRRIWR